jgi:site-specific recombinase XerD
MILSDKITSNSQWIGSFLSHLEAEKHLADSTLRAYRVDLNHYIKWLGEKYIIQMSTKTVMQFLDYVELRHAKPTLLRRLAALRTFYNWLHDREDLTMWFRANEIVNPMTPIKTPRYRRVAPKVMSRAEIQRLLEIPDDRKFLGARDRALMVLIYYCGIAVNELLAMDRGDMNFDRTQLVVKKKGRPDRLVPVGFYARDALTRYLQVLGTHPIMSRNTPGVLCPLFVNKAGNRLSTRSFRRKMGVCLKAANLNPKYTPHSLRHSFTAHQLEAGVPIEDVQAALGHRSVTTTKLYKPKASVI